MKRYLTLTVLGILAAFSSSAYSDHRGHNVDSLEAAVARWTPAEIAAAPDSTLRQIIKDWDGLMQGYLQTNGVKSEYYARKILENSLRKGWYPSVEGSCKVIGQIFWAKEQYDSALFYYRMALDALDRMAVNVASGDNPDGYTQTELDDGFSSMYGTVGNLYNMMDSLDVAFEYYAKAGEIFDRYGWDESNAVLYYNMGETWLEEGDYKKARECYETSLRYGSQAGDSLWIASPLKGLGAMYLAQGRTRKGLRCLEEADRYFSLHEDQEFRARLETLDFMGQILREQRRQLRMVIFILAFTSILLIVSLLAFRKLRESRKEGKEREELLEETLEEIPPSENAPVLSAREREILRLFAEGLTGPQIANRVCLSPETVKWYRKKLLAKFDASNTPELISRAKDAKLI